MSRILAISYIFIATAYADPMGARLDQARHAFAAGDLDGAAAAYERILQEEPRRTEALLSLGLVATARGDRTRARSCYQVLLEDPEERSDALFNLAILDREDGDPGAAAARLLEVVADRPDYPSARLALAEVLVEAGRGGDAEVHFKVAGELVPDDPYPLVARARLAVGRGDRPAAIALLEAAAGLDPEASDLLEEKARILDEGGDPKGARAARLEALARARTEPGAEGFVHRAELAIAIGDLDRARSELRGCLGLEPDHPRGRELGERLLGREGLRAVDRSKAEEALFSNPGPGAAP